MVTENKLKEIEDNIKGITSPITTQWRLNELIAEVRLRNQGLKGSMTYNEVVALSQLIEKGNKVWRNHLGADELIRTVLEQMYRDKMGNL